MRFRARRLAGCSVGVLVFATEARAAPKELLTIEWPSVAGCPSQKTVSTLAARAIADATEADRVLARADVTAPSLVGEPWRVRIRTRTIRGAGERVLEARTCDELGRATALLVALAALRTEEQPLDNETGEIVPEANRFEAPPLFIEAPQRGSWAEPSPRAESSLEPTFLASGGLFVDGGALPGLAVGPSFRLEWGLGSWRLRIGFSVALEQEQASRGLGATFNLFGASVDLCRSVPLRPIRPHVCVGGELDQVSATGIGDQRFESRRTTGLVFGGLGAEWSIAEHLRVGLDLRAGPSLRRPSYTVEHASGQRRELHEQSAVRGQVLGTFGVAF